MSLYLGTTPIANTGYDKANTDLSNLTSTGKNIANWSNNVTNCITEIPQDIKLEINSNNKLVLKAGSKVYIPNGLTGTTPKFDIVTTTNDITTGQGLWGTGKYFAVLENNTAVNHIKIVGVRSGTTEPTPTNGDWWYDTANNKIKKGNGTSWEEKYVSLPLGMITSTDGSNDNSIDQVFNGFGYIGSTVFALPGVKGLIPNGRNADGSLKNDTLELQNVKIYTETSYTGNAKIVFTSNGSFDFSSYSTWNYDESSNLFKYIPDGKLYSRLILTGLSLLSGKITTFEIPTAFHAVDYNDFNNIPHIVETYVNGTSWYRVYSDGWIEQGGYVTSSGSQGKTVNMLKSFNNTNYTVVGSCEGNGTEGYSPTFLNKTNSTFLWRTFNSGQGYDKNGSWYACGY